MLRLWNFRSFFRLENHELITIYEHCRVKCVQLSATEKFTQKLDYRTLQIASIRNLRKRTTVRLVGPSNFPAYATRAPGNSYFRWETYREMTRNRADPAVCNTAFPPFESIASNRFCDSSTISIIYVHLNGRTSVANSPDSEKRPGNGKTTSGTPRGSRDGEGEVHRQRDNSIHVKRNY